MPTTHDDLRELAGLLERLRREVLIGASGTIGIVDDAEPEREALFDVCRAVIAAVGELKAAQNILERLVTADRPSADILQFRRGPSDAVH